MTITGTNNIVYQVDFTDGKFEIERDDKDTGLRKVFVFADLCIGDTDSKRKEVVFYSYDIAPNNGARINPKRHTFRDTETEFDDFLNSEVWDVFKNLIVVEFLKKVEFTEIQQ